jgi:predicted nucleic acid-binding protein
VFRPADVTEATTIEYASFRLELKRAGTPIPTNDLSIAALCRQHGFSLLSRDRHFDRVSGLHRVSW